MVDMLNNATSIRIEKKFDSIYSLASMLNSRNLEQNSQILLNLTESFDYCQSMRDSNFMAILSQIIYDEWRELYEYLDDQNLIENNKLDDICKLRLNARAKAKKAMSNIITASSVNKNSNNNNNNKSEMRIWDMLQIVNNFNESFLVDQSFLYDSIKLNELNEAISDLLKRSFDDQQKNYLINLGVLLGLCELIEIVWNFLNIEQFQEQFNRITLNSLIILNNLTMLNANLTLSICSRKFSLNGLYKCLEKCYLIINEKLFSVDYVNYNKLTSRLCLQVEFDIIKIISSLIKNLNSIKSEESTQENITSSSNNNNNNNNNKSNLHLANNNKTNNDQLKALAINNFNEFNFCSLLTKCLLIYSIKRTSNIINNLNQSTLKSILNALLNLSSNSIENKSIICNHNGALNFLLDLISCSDCLLITNKPDDSITELAICLIRSLSVYYSMNDELRSQLMSNKFYHILLDMALTSSNLNIVSNACCILWSMTSRSTNDNNLLFSLGIETRLKSLSYSTSKLISMASLATLKNLYNNTNTNNLHTNNTLNSDQSISASTTCSSHNLSTSTSTSSSLSYSANHQPLLANRSRKQIIESSNEFLKTVSETKIIDTPTNSNTKGEAYSVTKFKDLDSFSSSSLDTTASTCSFSASNSTESQHTSTSSSDSSSDTDDTSSDFTSDDSLNKKHSYYLSPRKSRHSYYLRDYENENENDSDYSIKSNVSEYDNTTLTSKITTISTISSVAGKKSIIKISSNNDNTSSSSSSTRAIKHVTFNENKQILYEKRKEKILKIKPITDSTHDSTISSDLYDIDDIFPPSTSSKKSTGKSSSLISSKITVDSLYVPKKKFDPTNSISSINSNTSSILSRNKSPVSDMRFVKSNSIILEPEISSKSIVTNDLNQITNLDSDEKPVICTKPVSTTNTNSPIHKTKQYLSKSDSVDNTSSKPCWSSLVIMNKTCQMRCDRNMTLSTNNEIFKGVNKGALNGTKTNNQNKLVGLVRPLVASQNNKSNSESKEKIVSPNSTLKKANLCNKQSIKSRNQIGNLLKKNTFIIGDQQLNKNKNTCPNQYKCVNNNCNNNNRSFKMK